MRETRQSGSEGGARLIPCPYPIDRGSGAQYADSRAVEAPHAGCYGPVFGSADCPMPGRLRGRRSALQLSSLKRIFNREPREIREQRLARDVGAQHCFTT
jgi:hypothetical protein